MVGGGDWKSSRTRIAAIIYGVTHVSCMVTPFVCVVDERIVDILFCAMDAVDKESSSVSSLMSNNSSCSPLQQQQQPLHSSLDSCFSTGGGGGGKAGLGRRRRRATTNTFNAAAASCLLSSPEAADNTGEQSRCTQIQDKTRGAKFLFPTFPHTALSTEIHSTMHSTPLITIATRGPAFFNRYIRISL